MNNADKLKIQLLDFTKQNIVKFLQKNKDLTFYSFAFDCNSEYAEVNLCLNTLEDFEETLLLYQSGKYANNYQPPENIYNLKYNTGDWQFQSFETIYLMTEEEMTETYGEDIQKQIEDFIKLFSEVMIDFESTFEFSLIPKTEDFKTICIDHDEDLEVAQERLDNLRTLKQ